MNRRTGWPGSIGLVAVVGAILVPSADREVEVRAQTPQMPAGVARTQLVDNDAVSVARLVFEPGAAEEMHTHPFAAVVIQTSTGRVAMAIGDEKTDADRAPGTAWFVPREAPHAAANVGKTACQFTTVAIKPRPAAPAAAAPAPAAPPAGIARAERFDNDAARVVHVTFAAGATEVLHSHPVDLVIVQVTPGRVRVRIGDEVTESELRPGDAVFLPRDEPHLVANTGATAFELLSVTIK